MSAEKADVGGYRQGKAGEIRGEQHKRAQSSAGQRSAEKVEEDGYGQGKA